MNLIILDKNFQPLAPINTLQSLIWNRRYRDPGTFELHAGATDFAAVREGAYIYRDDRDELGVIYEADIRRNKAGAKTCYAKGYFAEKLLDDRVIDRTQRLTGTPEQIARDLVDRHFINTSSGQGDYSGRSLAGHLSLGPLSGASQTSTKYQGTGAAIGTTLYDLEAEQALSHRVTYDYAADQLLFSVWKGQDRGALLSDKYGNLTATSYHRDTTDAPNVIYVAGNGEGQNRKVVRLDLREDGESAREMYVDARDLQQTFIGEDGESYSYTDEDYEELLEARGRQRAAEHRAQERFEATADATANLVYRKDYDLGDFCLAEVDGVRLEKQITGIREIYEDGSTTIEITLGDYGPTSLQAAVNKQAHINQSSAPTSTDMEDLTKLLTIDKTGLVPAINEVFTDFEDLDLDVGDLTTLKTTDKSSIVGAINELFTSGGGGGGGGGGSLPAEYVLHQPVTLAFGTRAVSSQVSPLQCTYKPSDDGLSFNTGFQLVKPEDGSKEIAIVGVSSIKLALGSQTLGGVPYAGMSYDLAITGTAGGADVSSMQFIAQAKPGADPIPDEEKTYIPEALWANIMAGVRIEGTNFQQADYLAPLMLSNPLFLGWGKSYNGAEHLVDGYLWSYALTPTVIDSLWQNGGPVIHGIYTDDNKTRQIYSFNQALKPPIPPIVYYKSNISYEMSPVFHFVHGTAGWVGRLAAWALIKTNNRNTGSPGSPRSFLRWLDSNYISDIVLA